MTAGGGLPRSRSTVPEEEMARSRHDVTRLLDQWSEGDPLALDELIPLVEKDLRSIARSYFRSGDGDQTLQPTALVNDLYLRLHGLRTVHWKSSQHFFCVAAGMMRRLMVDRARHRKAAKRGGGVANQLLSDEIPLPWQTDPVDLIALNEALERLEADSPDLAQVVVLKAFADLKIREIAETLKIGPTTVKRYWRIARAKLLSELGRSSPASDDPAAGQEEEGGEGGDETA